MKNSTLKETLCHFLSSNRIDTVPSSFTKVTGLKRVPSMYFFLDTFTRQYSEALKSFTEDGLKLYLGLMHTEFTLLNKSLLDIAELTELEITFQTNDDSERNKTIRLDVEKFINNVKGLFPQIEITNDSFNGFLTEHRNKKGNGLLFEFYKEFIGKHSLYGLVYHHLNNKSEPLNYDNVFRLFKAANNLPTLNRDSFIMSVMNVFSTLAADNKTCTIIDSFEKCLTTSALNKILLSKLTNPEKTI